MLAVVITGSNSSSLRKRWCTYWHSVATFLSSPSFSKRWSWWWIPLNYINKSISRTQTTTMASTCTCPYTHGYSIWHPECYCEAASLDTSCVTRLRLSMKHHGQVSINAPYQSEACSGVVLTTSMRSLNSYQEPGMIRTWTQVFTMSAQHSTSNLSHCLVSLACRTMSGSWSLHSEFFALSWDYNEMRYSQWEPTMTRGRTTPHNW